MEERVIRGASGVGTTELFSRLKAELPEGYWAKKHAPGSAASISYVHKALKRHSHRVRKQRVFQQPVSLTQEEAKKRCEQVRSAYHQKMAELRGQGKEVVLVNMDETAMETRSRPAYFVADKDARQSRVVFEQKPAVRTHLRATVASQPQFSWCEAATKTSSAATKKAAAAEPYFFVEPPDQCAFRGWLSRLVRRKEAYDESRGAATTVALLLLLDRAPAHRAHLSMVALQEAELRGIFTVWIPGQCTRWAQPCDASGLFRSIKASLRDADLDFVEQPGAGIQNVMRVLRQYGEEAFVGCYSIDPAGLFSLTREILESE